MRDRARQLAADRSRGEPDATRHRVDLPASFAPTTPTISPSARVRSMSWRTRAREARVAIADRLHLEHVQTPRSARAMSATSAASEQPAQHPLRRVSGIDHSRCRAPGRLNARDSSARLRSSTSVSEVMITDRRSAGGRAVAPGCCPRCRGREPAGSRRSSAARSTSVGTASIVATATNANARRHPAALEVQHERARIGGQDEQADRGRDGEQPEERLRGESTPSSVASNGPTRQHGRPARVKTLTSTTEIAIGSDSSNDARSRRPSTPGERRQGQHHHDRHRPDYRRARTPRWTRRSR